VAKPVRLRERAALDIADAVDHLLDEAGADVARRFVAAIEEALERVGRAPRTAGSSRFAPEVDIPGLLAASVKRFPFVVFYIERDVEIDVWRVLHIRRDIPRALSREGSDDRSRE
jgi:toxin ParE1/3/4